MNPEALADVRFGADALFNPDIAHGKSLFHESRR
jgi:hypothetical protein